MAVLRQTYRAPSQDTGLPIAAPGTPRRSAVVWSLFGFVAATLFWNATGFGPSLSVVARGLAPEHTGSIAKAPKPADRLPLFARSGDGVPVQSNCTALVLDRTIQHTRPGDCLTDVPPLEYAHSTGRQDRLRPLE